MRGRRRSQELPITETPGVRRRPQRLRRRGFQLRFSALPYGSRSVSGFSSAALALLVVAAPLWAATNPRAAAEANAGLELAEKASTNRLSRTIAPPWRWTHPCPAFI